ncbi:T-cell activation Rho GTPase-activating protein-like, partial [Melopsittacus undulatus]|uniref:T-cell activation Rho GTPase-activating protein-like n=1 Tax=Melopsittacus undulatus TaxID=13146 RepID=UPI001469EC9D
PQPIQDLLALLSEQGPSTEGIFRLAASQRACREVREALDSGVPAQLETRPVLLLAVLLKDLLRNIPSKLLNVELFEEWMRAKEKTSRQERLAALKEVARKLPEANLLLLQHLLSLLSSISKNVATTKMTAGNLAICLAPNLLSPPQELPLDVLAQETGKVTQLVEFLIHHHEELFGEQVARLASKGDEETPVPQAELETAEVLRRTPGSEEQPGKRAAMGHRAQRRSEMSCQGWATEKIQAGEEQDTQVIEPQGRDCGNTFFTISSEDHV